MSRTVSMATLTALVVGLIIATYALETRARQGPIPAGGIISPDAEELLRRMSLALGKAETFSFRATTTSEELVVMGPMVEYSNEVRCVLSRDGRILSSVRGDLANRDALFENGSLTVIDHANSRVATESFPKEIEAMFDALASRFDVVIPLADFLTEDPFTGLTESAELGRLLGESTIDGSPCHHLAFRQESIDWQIWIDAAPPHLPRRFVVTDRTRPENPDDTAEFHEWVLDGEAPSFELAIPADAERISMGQLLEESQG